MLLRLGFIGTGLKSRWKVRFLQMARAPRLEVMMMMVFAKNPTVLPRPSVQLAVFEKLAREC